MNMNVYFGKYDDFKKFKEEFSAYPEIYHRPKDIYNYLLRVIDECEGDINILTLSPIVLNATEILAYKFNIKLKWFNVTDQITECNNFEQIYSEIAEPLQQFENMRYE